MTMRKYNQLLDDKQNSTVDTQRRAGHAASVIPPRYGIAVLDQSSKSKSDTAHLQTKLFISQPNDRHEREADRMADRVMQMPDTQPAGAQALADVSHQPVETVNRQAQLPITPLQNSDMSGRETSIAIPTNRSSTGTPIEAASRNYMESRFGQDFGHIRVHAGSEASQLCHSLQAKAFTLGSDIYFNEGQYNPSSNAGRRLLAHELTHTLQQQSSSTPTVQRYTAYDSAAQSGGTSLGWKHPAGTNIRVSDDGLLVVEDKGWNPGTNKRAWAIKSKIAQSNKILKDIGSNAKLVEKPGTIAGKAPNNVGGSTHTLVEIEPKKAAGAGAFSLIGDCGHAARQVMGSGGGKDVAVTRNKGGVESYTPPESYHGGAKTTPEVFFEEILKTEYGAALSRADLYDKYSKLSAADKDKFDKKYRINKYAVPEVGQAQTISSEFDMPGFATVPGVSTWNFHFAATVLKSGADHVTLESAAGWGAADWIFYMYGPEKKAQSFHEEHGATDTHGTHYTTMVVQSEKRLKGETSAAGVHLVADPNKWNTTLIAKLAKGTEVYTLKKGKSWRKVQVKNGPQAGKIGWISNAFFKEK